MTLWLVGQAKSETPGEWEFQGIFSTEEKAVGACRTAWYFVAPVELDKELPHETATMPGSYYPLITRSREKEDGRDGVS